MGLLQHQPDTGLQLAGEDYTLRPAAAPKDVLVVGGGLAGIHAALPCLLRGATGALPLRDIPGSDSEHVVQANNVLLGQARVGATVVVVGGNYVGMESALYLAERGHKVYLLTRSRVGRGVGRLVRRGLEDRLIERGVHMFPFSQAVEVGARGVKYLTDDWFEFRFLPADTIVLATGSASQKELYLQLRESLPEVYSVGDAVAPRDAFSAIHSAEDVARRI